MESALACYAGGRGSIPVVGSKTIAYSNGFFSLSGIGVRIHINWTQTRWNGALASSISRLKILATPSVGEHGNKCELWVAKSKKKPQLDSNKGIHYFDPNFISRLEFWLWNLPINYSVCFDLSCFEILDDWRHGDKIWASSNVHTTIE